MLTDTLYCVSVSKDPSPTTSFTVPDAPDNVGESVFDPTVIVQLSTELLEYGAVLPP